MAEVGRCSNSKVLPAKLEQFLKSQRDLTDVTHVIIRKPWQLEKSLSIPFWPQAKLLETSLPF
jgi:hypothetical protein